MKSVSTALSPEVLLREMGVRAKIDFHYVRVGTTPLASDQEGGELGCVLTVRYFGIVWPWTVERVRRKVGYLAPYVMRKETRYVSIEVVPA
jgi:hypothetical protein